MLNPEYLKELGIEFIINYNRKSRQDEERERRTGDDTLKETRDLMDGILIPLGIPYDQDDEIGSGDKISSRPIFQDVLQRLREDKYQAIAVKEITRLGRGSYTDMGVIYDLIVDKCIYIITPWKVYDPKNNADLKQIRFELFLSREEFETTKERLAGGRYTKALAGQWMAGAPPYGYDKDKNNKLHINDGQAPIVSLIFDLYVNGLVGKDGVMREVSHRAICTYLQRKNIMSPEGNSNWNTSVVEHMLGNEVYIGTNIYGSAVKKNAFPPIVDEEIFMAAKEKSDLPKNFGPPRPRLKLDAAATELTSLIVCKKCGGRMLKQHTSQYYTRKTDNQRVKYTKEFLWCRKTGCNFVKYRSVEEDLLIVMQHFCSLDVATMKSKIEQMVERKKKSTVKEKDIKIIQEKTLQKLKMRRNFILEKYEDGMYSDEVFRERMAEVELKISELSNATNQVAASKYDNAENPEPDYSLIQSKIKTLVDAYKTSTSIPEKNDILRKVFSYVVVDVLEKGHGSIPAKHVTFPVLNPLLTTAKFLGV